MDYIGTVKNGVVVLDVGVNLTEGALVRIVVLDDADRHPTLEALFRDVAGKAVGLPEDLAENHDHYLHRLPKKSSA